MCACVYMEATDCLICVFVCVSTNFLPAYPEIRIICNRKGYLFPSSPSYPPPSLPPIFGRFILIHLVSFLGCLYSFVKGTRY